MKTVTVQSILLNAASRAGGANAAVVILPIMQAIEQQLADTSAEAVAGLQSS